MPRTFNIAIPATMLLSALLLSACASNSESDAVSPAQVNAIQPGNNFGRDADTENTTATKASPASATSTTTITKQPPTIKNKKAVKKSKKPVKKPEPTQ